MPRPKSYFERDVKLKTPEAMFQRLEQLTGKPIPSGGLVVSAASTITATADGGKLPSATRSADHSVPRDRQPLEWHAHVTTDDGGYIRSTCGTYTVTKSRSMGKWVYTASHHRTCLPGACTSADEAKRIAQEHANT